MFADASEKWALKGGVSMLVRVPPRARYSQDVDLVHLPANPDQAANELARIGQLNLDDYLRFQVGARQQLSTEDAAMYERHGEAGQTASNRWRDLADLVLLVEEVDLEADRLTQALTIRAQRARSPVKLPPAMRPPGLEWETGYPKFAAAETLIPERYHDLDEVLRFVGECLNPILNGNVTTGRWNPRRRRWDT